MKKEIIFSAIAVVSIAIVLVGKSSNSKEEPTMAENCAIPKIQKIIDRYPAQHTEFISYEITGGKYDESIRMISVEGNLTFSYGGDVQTQQFSNKCRVVE